MMNKSDVVAFIENCVGEHAQISGSKLSALLRAAFPEWAPSRFEATTLVEFVERNAPLVAVVGRAGLDNIYGLASQAPAARKPLEQIDLWRAWVSPNSSFALEVKIQTGEIAAVERKQTAREGWARLPTPTIDQHRQLARDFLALQFPEGDEELERIAGQQGAWWQTWMVRIRRLNLATVWREFRTARLRSLFESALAAIDLSAEAQKSATTLLDYLAIPEFSIGTGILIRPTVQTQSELRKLVLRAVEQMSEEDLAQLRLPVGLLQKVLKSLHE